MKKLENCNKDELLFILHRLERYLGGARHIINHALIDMEMEEQITILDEAEKWAEVADKKRQEYIKLLSLVAGQEMTDETHKIFREAEKLAKEAEYADKKYIALMRED